METAGLVIGVAGLAGLFNSCLEAVDKVQSYQTFGTDSHVLDTRFKVARARFERWGPGVGIEQGKLLPDHHSALDDKDTSTVVTDVLHFIIKAICDASKPPRRTRAAGPGDDDSSGLHRLKPPYAVTSESRRRKMAWALWRKGGRTEQVELFEKLVQELHNLVPPNTGESTRRAHKPDTGRTDTLALGTTPGHAWPGETRRILDRIEGEIRAETRRELHSWLGRCSPNERYHDSLQKRVNGTCDWILDRPAFRHWLAIEVSAGPKLLWVNGPAGFGKTILCAHVVEHLSSNLDTPVAHFFFTSDLESREDPYLALRSWISQIVSCHEGAFEHVRQRWESDSDPVATRATTITLFTQLLHAIPGCTFVADGLDECTYLDNSSTSVAKFLHDVTDAVARTNARVLFVSRDEPEIRHALIDDARESFAEYKIMPEDVRSDTAAYSRSIVNRKLPNKSDDVRLTLSEAMTDRCQGQFLWLKMQEESLRRGMNKKQLQHAIAHTPTGLDHLYDHNWTRVTRLGEWERHRAFALLRWAAFALRPLTVCEITEAALILESEDLPLEDFPDPVDDDYVNIEIVGLCGPLLEIRNDPINPSPSQRTVHLPHFSVRQYLLCQLPTPSWIRQNDRLRTSYEQLQNTVLAKACLQYVSLRQVWEDVPHDSPPSLGMAFRNYAATTWHQHVNSGIHNNAEIVQLCVKFLSRDNPVWDSWRTLIESEDVERQGTEADTIPRSPLYYAVMLHLPDAVKLHFTDAAISLAQPASAAPPTDSGYASTSVTGSGLDRLSGCGDQGAVQFVQEPANQDFDDAATEYSNASSTTISRQRGYIWELADYLFSETRPLNSDKETQKRVSAVLPELLKGFALKLGHHASTQMHRDAMAFVHKHRREIAAAFTDIGFKQDEEGTEKSTGNSDVMCLKDRMSHWFQKTRQEEELVDLGLNESKFSSTNPAGGDDEPTNEIPREVVETEDEDVPENWLLAYREFVFSSEACKWLLARLRKEFHLVPTEPNTIRAIGDKIMSSLPSAHRISRKVSSQSCSARFELDWDIFQFFETQEYLNRPDEVFEGIITLTGSCLDAQAATCAQYIHQTWPLTGEVILKLIKGALKDGEGHSHRCKLSDGTKLSAWVSGSKFVAEANGVAASVAETGEQLAWLGAALRTSLRQSGLVYCTPIITGIFQNSAPSHQPGLQPSSTDITCEIGFVMEEVRQTLSTANGQCWHDIFKNPVVVKGYPIPQRIEWSTGLEIPLNIMAGLARTQRVDRFNDKVYIKGFSTMLVPTKRNEDILCWHLIYNKDGSRISYLDDHVGQDQHIGRLDLENLRHVLGWCSEARLYAGSAQAHYPVTHSGLPKPHAGCALAKTFVSPGRMIMGGPTFDIGAKDTPIQVSRNGYIPRLKWISTKFVLLWDECDKRGWLINGTSVLLHVVRASLAHDSKDKFRSAFLFNSEDLQESNRPFTTDSAIDVLINSKNLGLKLYPEKDGHLLLESRIDHFYNVLEKLIDHQADIAGDCGGNLSDLPRRYLEGWDFEELATNRDPLYPRVATLEPGGKAWVDFTRAVQAVTLVGRCFGDIIRPAGADICDYWAELPKQQYYIASCLSDLSEVVKGHGSHGDSHVRLSDNLIWHTPTTIFGSCRCRGALGQDHCEPVQTLFPSALSRTLLPRRHPVPREGHGALIFGHSSNFSWVWGDTGHPQEGDLKEAASSSRSAGVDLDSLKDSGIGSILTTPGSEGRASSWSRSSTRLMRSPSDFHTDTATPDSADSIGRETYTPRHYTVGIICALPKELMAIRALFDRKHDSLETALNDSNHYALGQMAQHMVVAACLPAGEYGTNSAATVASNMVRSFPLRFCLLVGIGGGAPSQQNDIRLGDVVVGLPEGKFSGVIQYDLGKEKGSSFFERTGTLQRPPRVLTTAISAVRSDPDLLSDPLGPHLRKITARMPWYSHPGRELDVLFETCMACQSSQKVCPEGGCHERRRVPRPTVEPMIHYGLVASGNRVVKDAVFRDRLAREHGVLCFEMEAAGVVNEVPCLVIRGICDYCDVHKNDAWHNYAAATAAAYSKLLLTVVARKAKANNVSMGNAHSTPKPSAGSKRRWSEHEEE